MTADYEIFHFNTMVAKLMELSNALYRYRGSSVAGGPEWDEAIRLLLLMLAPAAPHVTEELWSRRLAANGEEWSSIHTATWPTVDEAAAAESTREVPVQVNGKVRDRGCRGCQRRRGRDRGRRGFASPRIQQLLAGRTPTASSRPAAESWSTWSCPSRASGR